MYTCPLLPSKLEVSYGVNIVNFLIRKVIVQVTLQARFVFKNPLEPKLLPKIEKNNSKKRN